MKYSVYFCLILHYINDMPDYNVKNISSLKTRIQILDKIIVVVWVGLIVLIYFDISWAVAVILVAQLTLYIIRRRMKKDLNQKEILAKMVEERTAGLRQERDKVVQESKELSDALEALAKAQNELVRKEKMATVGNLTSGLVDRILNPVNYINNFSGLTISTLQELRGEIDSVRDSIPADKYEDICETLEIIDTNLSKINDHGCNTVRIVKAMEELIKTRHSNITLTDIRTVCKVNVELARKHFAKTIELNGIDLRLHSRQRRDQHRRDEQGDAPPHLQQHLRRQQEAPEAELLPRDSNPRHSPAGRPDRDIHKRQRHRHRGHHQVPHLRTVLHHQTHLRGRRHRPLSVPRDDSQPQGSHRRGKPSGRIHRVPHHHSQLSKHHSR